MESQKGPKRKVSGGRYHNTSSKKKRDLARFPAMTLLGELKPKTIRVKGGNEKRRLLSGNEVNVVLKDGAAKKTKIKSVLENPANKHLARRSILTKGTIVDTEHGKARITSRPGQQGILNAVVIK